MKAALNGTLNLSTLDGWWAEAYTPEAGWVIGAGESYNDVGYQDLIESQTLYNLLENEIVPLFYTRSASGLPRAWINRMKSSIKWIAPRFNTNRMLSEYTRKFYNPTIERWRALTDSNMASAKDLTAWKTNVKQAWSELAVKTTNVEINDGNQLVPLSSKQPNLEVGAELKITATARLGILSPDDIEVEVYHGPVDSWGNITDGSSIKMTYEASTGVDNEHTFTALLPCRLSGQHGFALRILPKYNELFGCCEPGLIRWESATSKTPVKVGQT
jgi:starch phosphorylase